MKKLISLLLVFVMCAAVFAGCAKEDTTGLDKAKEYLFSMYKDSRDTETAIDYTVVSAVSIDSTTYKVTWTIEKVEGDISCLSVEAGATMTTIKVAKNFTEQVVKYNLVGTISDEKGNTASVSFGHSVPISKPVQSLEDGTYVISANGLSMAAMGETYTYGYPTANQVTETTFTATDIVTIKNVTGGVTIQDSYGRYYYLKGTYNSFNLSTEMPEEGHVFELQINDDGTVSFVNILMQKTLAYSTSYTSWGCYSTLGEGYLSALTIFAADANKAHVHTEEVIPGKAATCTEDGLTEGKKCSECGAILVAQTTIKAAHTWGEWEVTKEATIEEDGEKTHTCTVCGESESETFKFVATEWVPVTTAPEADTAYIFGMNQITAGKVLYFNGELSGHFLATTEKASEAVGVKVEVVDGGYKLYFLNEETKTYISIESYTKDDNSTGVGMALVTDAETASVFTFDTALGIFKTTVADSEYYMGSYNSFETISASKTSHITAENAGVSQFQAQLYIEVVADSGEDDADTAYKMEMVQASLNKTLYFNGKMDDNYLATTENVAEAVDVFVETVEGGYRLYFMDGEVKTYIDIVLREGETSKTNVKLVTEPTCVYTWNEELGIYTAAVGEGVFYLGTFGTYNTMSPSSTYYITGDNAGNVGVSQFLAKLVVKSDDATTEPDNKDDNTTEPDNKDDNKDDNNTENAAPVVGTAYTYGMVQGNLNNTTYYLAGGMNSFYMATTDNVASALKVYLEETDGGYYLYCYVDDVKTYINMFEAVGTDGKNHVNSDYQTTASTVYTYDAEKDVLVTTIGEKDYTFGTRNDKQYTTVGPVEVSYNGFWCKLAA